MTDAQANPFAAVQPEDLAPEDGERVFAPTTDEQAAAVARYTPPPEPRPEPPLHPLPLDRPPAPARTPPSVRTQAQQAAATVKAQAKKAQAVSFKLTLRLPADLWDELGSANMELDITTLNRVKTLNAAFKFWHEYIATLRKTYLVEEYEEEEDEEEEPTSRPRKPAPKKRKTTARKKTRARQQSRGKKATPKQIEWLGELDVPAREAKKMTYQDAFDLIGELTEAEKDNDDGTLFTCCECGEEFYVEDELPYIGDARAFIRKVGADNITCEACR